MAAQQLGQEDDAGDDLPRVILENYLMLAAATETQNQGRLADMLCYLRKVHGNLLEVARAIDSATAVGMQDGPGAPITQLALGPALEAAAAQAGGELEAAQQAAAAAGAADAGGSEQAQAAAAAAGQQVVQGLRHEDLAALQAAQQAAELALLRQVQQQQQQQRLAQQHQQQAASRGGALSLLPPSLAAQLAARQQAFALSHLRQHQAQRQRQQQQPEQRQQLAGHAPGPQAAGLCPPDLLQQEQPLAGLAAAPAWLAAVNQSADQLLAALGLSEYAPLLQQNGIDSAALQLLDDAQLRALGLSMGAVVKLRAALRMQQQQQQP